MRFFPQTTTNNLKGMGLIFYCKDCEKIVDVFPVGRKFVYKCAICKTKNVAFGTDKSIRNFFRLPEEDKTAPVVTTTTEKAPVAPPATAQVAEKPAMPTQVETTEPTPIPENK